MTEQLDVGVIVIVSHNLILFVNCLQQGVLHVEDYCFWKIILKKNYSGRALLLRSLYSKGSFCCPVLPGFASPVSFSGTTTKSFATWVQGFLI